MGIGVAIVIVIVITITVAVFGNIWCILDHTYYHLYYFLSKDQFSGKNVFYEFIQSLESKKLSWV